MAMTGHVLDRLAIERYIRDDLGPLSPPPTPNPVTLNASVANVLLTRSPAHAKLAHPRLNPKWESDDSEASDLGTIAHALLLEGVLTRLVIVGADDWRTKAAKEQRDTARREGKIPVLEPKVYGLMSMIAAARKAIAASELGAEWAAGKVEQTLVWQEDGVWCRCRPDWMSADGRIIVDYKTTAGSAEPEAWSRSQMLTLGYDVQGAFLAAGVEAVLLENQSDSPVIFLVQETDPPYACSFIALDPMWLDFAERKRKRALAMWWNCLAHDEWPDYGTRIHYASPPEYALTRWGERMILSGEATVDEL